MFSDGVSKLWILRTGRGQLQVEGFKNEAEAIQYLIRHVLAFSSDTEAAKALLGSAIATAMQHMDETEQPPESGE